MEIDFSKGTALHRLYGHYVFTIEARKKKKTERFILNVCSSLKCDGRSTPWRDSIINNLERRI